MEHVLDNPAWNALISGNKHLSHGNEQLKYFAKEVSLFAGMKENSPGNFQSLYEMIPHEGPIGFIMPRETDIPNPWKVLQAIKALQMVHTGAPIPAGSYDELVPLKEEHVPQMLALTKLTNPGPFTSRTIDFGHYKGIFDGDRLIAMAGQRLHIFEYMEISAVCTHPDYLGRGYARRLLLYQLNRILAASGTPFLHVRHDNERAIKVYEQMGFSTRKHIYFYICKK